MNVRALRIAGVALLALTGVVAGMWLYSNRHAPPPAVPPRVVRVPAGEASPPSPSDDDAADSDALPQPKIPERLPDFTLEDRSGKPTPISTWRGKSLMLNFWATWCAPCRREIPLLATLQGTWAARGFEVVGVAVDYRDKVAAFADEFKIPYPLLVGEQDALDAAARLGVESPVFPFTVFTDGQGEVVTLYLGELHPRQADLILSMVESLNANRLSLTEARRRIADGLLALKAQPGV
jgi:thiol-disulfide isomerase/thioredoxin